MLLEQYFNKHGEKENDTRQGDKSKGERYNISDFWKDGGMCFWGLDFASSY